MTYLVLGATGLQGGPVVRHLLKRDQPVRILTRIANSDKARALTEQGVDVYEGDLSKPETLPDVFANVNAVFSVQDFYAPNTGLVGELQQGRNVIEASGKAGVRHIVQSTMGDGNATGGPAHFLSKSLIERDLKKSGLDWTALGTVWFMDNLLNPQMKPHMMFPVLTGSLKPDTKFQMLATDDLGWVAAEALTNTREWKNRKINLAGDVMTVPEMKLAYRKISGKRAKSWSIPPSMFRRLAPEFEEQLAWHNEINFAFGTRELAAAKPGMTTFSEFLRKHQIQDM